MFHALIILLATLGFGASHFDTSSVAEIKWYKMHHGQWNDQFDLPASQTCGWGGY